MTESRTHPPTFRLSLRGTSRLPRYFEALPFGALLLDASGRILRHTPAEGPGGRTNRGDLVGVDFFGELFAGTELEEWGEIFLQQVGRGELARVANLEVPGLHGPREIAFFFYYHQRNAEAWVFIEPVPHSADAGSTCAFAA